jgi:hypothetical protein
MSLCFFSVFVLFCVCSGLATGLITRPRSPTNCLQDSQFDSEWEQAIESDPSRKKKNLEICTMKLSLDFSSITVTVAVVCRLVISGY